MLFLKNPKVRELNFWREEDDETLICIYISPHRKYLLQSIKFINDRKSTKIMLYFSHPKEDLQFISLFTMMFILYFKVNFVGTPA